MEHIRCKLLQKYEQVLQGVSEKAPREPSCSQRRRSPPGHELYISERITYYLELGYEDRFV
jgi:hypothetical protein